MNENKKEPAELTRELIEALADKNDICESFEALKMIIKAHRQKHALLGMIIGYYEGLELDPIGGELIIQRKKQ